jgi:archaellum biogenesis ATPase FlaH
MGDLVEWNSFLEKYNKFIDAAKYQFHAHDFDTKEELDKLRILHERITKDKMIVDSLDYMHRAV